MNKENAIKLWKVIQEAGDFLKGQLPEHPNHPKGRNPYAHVAICIKNKFSQSYKDIPDEKYNEVIEYINFLKEKSKLELLLRKIVFKFTFSINICCATVKSPPNA